MGILIEVNKLSTFEISLASNPTTGFSWAVLEDLPNTIEHISNGYVMPKPQNPMVMGQGGQEVWVFKALEAGRFSFQMEYRSPFAEGDSDKETVEVIVK